MCDVVMKLMFTIKSGYKSLDAKCRPRLRTVSNRIKWGRSAPCSTRLIKSDPARVKYYQLESKETDINWRERKDRELHHLLDMEKGGFSHRKNTGKIIDGNWDKNRRSWEEHIVYKSFKMVYNMEYNWDKTPFIQLCLEQIEEKGSSYKYENKNEFLSNRIEYLEWLHDNIKNHGYKTQKEASKDHRNKSILHEVGVNIGRNGEIIFNNRSGQHRLSFAKILNLTEIPMLVVVRHREWQKIRQKVYEADCIEDLNQSIVDKLDHPDLEDVRPSHWSED